MIAALLCAAYSDEGACILLECESDDPTIRKEIKRRVMKTVTEANLLPSETTSGIFPGVIVVSKLMNACGHSSVS